MIDKVKTLGEAAALIRDGDVVGLQGGPTQCAPMTLVREIIRAGRKDLRAVTLSGGIALDWLAAAGCLSACTFAAVTMEHFGLCRAFRCQVEAGAIAVEELSETALFARLGAAARGLPFLPVRGLIGTDLLNVGNEALRVIADPFGGPPVVACRALPLDVAILHAHRADHAGNVGIDPGPRYPTMTTMPRAARRVIVTVERIVPDERTAQGARPDDPARLRRRRHRRGPLRRPSDLPFPRLRLRRPLHGRLGQRGGLAGHRPRVPRCLRARGTLAGRLPEPGGRGQPGWPSSRSGTAREPGTERRARGGRHRRLRA